MTMAGQHLYGWLHECGESYSRDLCVRLKVKSIGQSVVADLVANDTALLAESERMLQIIVD